MNKLILALVALMPLLGGCALFGGAPAKPGEQVVITEPENLKPDVVVTPGHPGQQATVYPVDKLPQPIRGWVEKVFPGKKLVAITELKYVLEAVSDNPATPEDEFKPAPPMIPLEPPGDEAGNTDFMGWLEQALPVIGSTLPGGWAGGVGLAYSLLLLLRRRSRTHLKNAAADLNPLDEGYVDIKGATSNLAKAVGLKHSAE